MMVELHYPSICYAAWCGSAQDRPKSASGGLSHALGKWCLKNGGVVYGARWNDSVNAVIMPAETDLELEKFRGAKYVQSLLARYTVEQMRQNLDAGRMVLFVGLPCQVAAVRETLGCHEKLFCVDLLCHGVRPSRDFRSAVEDILHKKCINEWTDIRFRGNDSHDFHLSIWNNDICLYDRPAEDQPYFKTFLAGVGLKEACYSCQFARPERLGDLTLGDFIGLGSSSSFDAPSSGNVSFVAVNTEQGALMVEALREQAVNLFERPYEERLTYPYSVRIPFPRPFADKLFRKVQSRLGYDTALKWALAWLRFNEKFVGIKRQLGINGSLKFWKK